MATESSIQYTPGQGGNIHAWNRTIASTTTSDQAMARAESTLATYTAIARAVRVNVANSHPLIIHGDGTNYVRLRRLTIRQANLAAAASTLDIRVLRTTTLGTGGTSVNARSLDAGDTSPYSGTVMTLPTSKGTEGDELVSFRLPLAAAEPIDNNIVEWRQSDHNTKPIIVGNGPTNGFCVKNVGATGVHVDIEAEFAISDYL